MTDTTITPYPELASLSDRELFERVARQLDHLDQMLHEQGQLLDEIKPLVPLIPRALALLDPMAKMRRKWRADAVPVREATPVHVGEASEDRAEVGT